jgi:hypothetical protein
MLHAGLDLSRRRLDVCLVDDAGELVAQLAAAPDADGLRHLARRVAATRVRAVIESMNGARFVHDTLEELGWEVLIADAQKVNGASAVGVQDRQDRRARAGGALAARLGAGDLAARSDDPPRARAGAFPLHLVRHRTTLKNRVHATLITFGHPWGLFEAAVNACNNRSTPSATPAHQAPARPSERPQGRPDRALPRAHRSDLAHAHPQPTFAPAGAGFRLVS